MASLRSTGGEGGNRALSARGPQTRARLIEAAKEVFEKKGFLDARISDIAVAAGLSHGSFYHYYESKEEILREVAIAVDERLSAPLGSVMLDPSSSASPAERIREALRRYLESYDAEARIMGVIEQVSRYDSEVGALRRERHQRYSRLIADSIRQMQLRQMADETLDPEVAAAALSAMTIRFAEMWLAMGAVRFSFEEVVDQLGLFFENSMTLTGGRCRHHQSDGSEPGGPPTA